MLKKLCIPFFEKKTDFYKYNPKTEKYEYIDRLEAIKIEYYDYHLEDITSDHYDSIVEKVYTQVKDVLECFNLTPRGRKVNYVRNEVCIYVESDDIDEDYDTLNKKWFTENLEICLDFKETDLYLTDVEKSGLKFYSFFREDCFVTKYQTTAEINGIKILTETEVWFNFTDDMRLEKVKKGEKIE